MISLKLWLLALLWASLWFGFALAVEASGIMILVQDDQRSTFLQVDWRNPYAIAGFVNPPWAALPLALLQLLPMLFAIWIQFGVYFCLLAAIIWRYGTPKTAFRAALIVFTSPFALLTGFELNLEWLVCIGLLVPPVFSAPFLLVKPQVALGYVLSFPWCTILYWLMGALMVLLASFLIWGDWITALSASSAQKLVVWGINAAPQAMLNIILPAPLGTLISLAIGLWLAWRAIQRQDALLGIWAGIFCVPYIAAYSLMPAFALLTARHPRSGLLVSIGIWLLVIQAIAPLVGKL